MKLRPDVIEKTPDKPLTAGAERGKIELSRTELDYLGTAHREEIITPHDKWSFKIYQQKGYVNTWSETFSENAQKMATYLSETLATGAYGQLDRIVIAKHSSLRGIASYSQSTNTFYICEELLDVQHFAELVDRAYFAAHTLDEIIQHELGGHKRHWDMVKRFYERNKSQFTDLFAAKQSYEKKIRDYIIMQLSYDPLYLKRTISANANYGFNITGINETLADGIVLLARHELQDINLADLIREVLGL